MKIVFIALLFIICIASSGLNEKTFFTFNIYQSAQDGGPKAPLERIAAALSKGSKNPVYEIQGSNSSVRIKVTDAIFRAASDNATAKTDPATVIQLYKLAVSKNKRTFSLTASGKFQSTAVSISFQQDYFLNYKIILFNNLVPGEYAFIDKTTATADGSVTVFAFGID